MDDHDLGLAHDLDALARSILQRRRALGWLAGAGALSLFGCGGGGSDSSTATTTSSTSSTSTSTETTDSTSTTTSCSVIPEETAGPYPGDGSNDNGLSVLTLSGIVRSDIRSSIGGASGTADGVPLAVKLTLVNANASCADLSGYAIYLWHCDRDGKYSLYSAGVTDQNYLRGVQETASDGTVTFTTIFPACYSGRMPHIHFEVYRSLTTATSYTNKLKTSQMAFPTDVCSTVYSTASGYGASITNLSRISFATDNVFSDGVGTQTVTISGSVTDGYAAELTVGIGT